MMPTAQAGRRSLEARVKERVARVEALQPTWPTRPLRNGKERAAAGMGNVYSPVSKKSAGKFHSVGRWDIREALRRTCRRPRRRRPRRRRPRRRRPRRCRRRCRRGHQAEISGVPWSPDVCLAKLYAYISSCQYFAIVFFRGLGKFCPLQDTARPAWRIAIGRRRSRLISPSTSCAGLSARSCQQGKVFHAGVTQVGAFKGGSGPKGLYSLSSQLLVWGNFPSAQSSSMPIATCLGIFAPAPLPCSASLFRAHPNAPVRLDFCQEDRLLSLLQKRLGAWL